uniref:Uncharacterized protein n=1 Tax=Anopheles melas TaxID=34690 RepID=A0A182UJ96_9DIPT
MSVVVLLRSAHWDQGHYHPWVEVVVVPPKLLQQLPQRGQFHPMEEEVEVEVERKIWHRRQSLVVEAVVVEVEEVVVLFLGMREEVAQEEEEGEEVVEAEELTIVVLHY